MAAEARRADFAAAATSGFEQLSKEKKGVASKANGQKRPVEKSPAAVAIADGTTSEDQESPSESRSVQGHEAAVICVFDGVSWPSRRDARCQAGWCHVTHFPVERFGALLCLNWDSQMSCSTVSVASATGIRKCLVSAYSATSAAQLERFEVHARSNCPTVQISW